MNVQALPKSFEELVLESDLPVLADFWAEWCGACKSVSPVVKRIALEFHGRLVTVKVNVDKKVDVASRYNVQSIPTFILFHKGIILMRITGAVQYDALKAEIEKRIN